MQDGPIFCDVDLFASQNCLDTGSQTAVFRQLKEEPEGFVSNAIRVIEVQTHCFDGQALPAFWIIGEKLSQMQFSDLLVMRFECLPGRAGGD
jgi:hypothetical protein